jgi:hypothetical protein
VIDDFAKGYLHDELRFTHQAPADQLLGGEGARRAARNFGASSQ